MTNNLEHEYPALSLSAAWRILGASSVDDLKAQYAGGALVDELKRASAIKKVRVWSGDVAYKFDHADCAKKISALSAGIGEAEAGTTNDSDNDIWNREQRVSPHLYQLLRDLPVIVQEDNEFWLYLTCVLLLPLLLGHKPANKEPRQGKLAGKHIGTPKQTILEGAEEGESDSQMPDNEPPTREKRANDILAKRMFLRGRIATRDDSTTPVYKPLPNASEAESSHILTGRTVRQHEYAAKLVGRIRNAKSRPNQKQLRAIVRDKLNVKKATKVVETLKSTELEDLFNNTGI